MAEEDLPYKMVLNMEAQMKQRCVTELLHAEKMASINIHQHLLNVYGDQTVDVRTTRWWVVCINSGNSGSPPLVQIFMGTACRLLFITGENTQLMVVTVLKNSVF